MKENLNEVEAVKIGITIEEQGYQFYTVAAEHARNESTRKLFSRLALEEQQHIEDFKEILELLHTDQEKIHGYDDPAANEYLMQLVNSHIFSSQKDATCLAKEIKDDYEALMVGVQTEKDAIMFYTELYNNAQDPKGQEAFARLIEKEKGHLKLLMNVAQAIK